MIKGLEEAAEKIAHFIRYSAHLPKEMINEVMWECSCEWLNQKEKIVEDAIFYLGMYSIEGNFVEEALYEEVESKEHCSLITKMIHITLIQLTGRKFELTCTKRIQRFKVNGEFLYDISCLPEEWRTSTVIKKFREFGINTF